MRRSGKWRSLVSTCNVRPCPACLSLSACMHTCIVRACTCMFFQNAYSARMCRETVSLTLTFVRAQTFPLSLSPSCTLSPSPASCTRSPCHSPSRSLAPSLPLPLALSLSPPLHLSLTHSLARTHMPGRCSKNGDLTGPRSRPWRWDHR